MSGSEVALDTTAAITILNKTAAADDWVDDNSSIFLPVPVVGELRFGALASMRTAENLKRIDGLIVQSRIHNVTLGTTDFYAQVRATLKSVGRPIPENDIWIAALCLQYDLPLATTDEHFSFVEGLVLAERKSPSD